MEQAQEALDFADDVRSSATRKRRLMGALVAVLVAIPWAVAVFQLLIGNSFLILWICIGIIGIVSLGYYVAEKAMGIRDADRVKAGIPAGDLRSILALLLCAWPLVITLVKNVSDSISTPLALGISLLGGVHIAWIYLTDSWRHAHRKNRIKRGE